MKHSIIMKKADIALYLLAIINLLVMHYTILLTCRLENYTDVTMWIDNLLGAVFDVTIVLAIALLLTWRRLHTALFITAIVTMLWAFCNVLYSRFFHHYLSLSAIGQAGTLADSFMLSNMAEGVEWFDLVFACLGAMACWLYIQKQTGNAQKDNDSMRQHILPFLLTIPACVIVADILFHSFFCLITPGMASLSYFNHRMISRHLSLIHTSAEPNWATFHRGSFRQLAIPKIYYAFSSVALSNEQRAAIHAEYSNHKERTSLTETTVKGKNIIFIIVESYLAATSDLKVDGHEVTPFLNALKRDSTVYYNGQLTSNISIGESSDGQFLYMTGLLPLRSEVTVTKAKNAELPSLPKILKTEGFINEAYMVIPTLPSMWEQEDMCKKYRFDHLYTSADYKDGAYWYLSDRQIFEYALEKDLAAPKPFLSVVLTMSMHQPYTEPKDETFIVKDKTLTEKYRNYLSTCHYTDKQLKWYFNQLKAKGLYDNCLIVIVADHHAHPALFDMNDNELSTDIPLYIVNGGINNNDHNIWQGHCNQLDVFTTLLDLLGTKNSWRGFGHTLLTPQYHDSLRPELWTMSESIVMGNYFK